MKRLRFGWCVVNWFRWSDVTAQAGRLVDGQQITSKDFSEELLTPVIMDVVQWLLVGAISVGRALGHMWGDWAGAVGTLICHRWDGGPGNWRVSRVPNRMDTKPRYIIYSRHTSYYTKKNGSVYEFPLSFPFLTSSHAKINTLDADNGSFWGTDICPELPMQNIRKCLAVVYTR